MATKKPYRAVDLRPEYERIGQWLKAERLKRGLGQREVCRRLEKPEAYLTKIETGRQRIDLVEFLDLSRTIGIATNTTLGDIFSIADKV